MVEGDARGRGEGSDGKRKKQPGAELIHVWWFDARGNHVVGTQSKLGVWGGAISDECVVGVGSTGQHGGGASKQGWGQQLISQGCL